MVVRLVREESRHSVAVAAVNSDQTFYLVEITPAEMKDALAFVADGEQYFWTTPLGRAVPEGRPEDTNFLFVRLEDKVNGELIAQEMYCGESGSTTLESVYSSFSFEHE